MTALDEDGFPTATEGENTRLPKVKNSVSKAFIFKDMTTRYLFLSGRELHRACSAFKTLILRSHIVKKKVYFIMKQAVLPHKIR